MGKKYIVIYKDKTFTKIKRQTQTPVTKIIQKSILALKKLVLKTQHCF